MLLKDGENVRISVFGYTAFITQMVPGHEQRTRETVRHKHSLNFFYQLLVAFYRKSS